MGEEFPRVGLEGEHCGGQPGLLLGLAVSRQQGLMAAMHAIEVADGQHAAVLGALGARHGNLHGADFREARL